MQAWLLEKPAARADEDAPCLAAALMAQRPPYERPREDALLEAERSHQRHLIAQSKRAVQAEQRVAELERSNIRQRVERLGEILERAR